MKTVFKYLIPISLACLSTTVMAGSTLHRLVWDANPASQATIGFSPSGSANHHVKYGLSTDENTWQRKNISNKKTFSRSLKSEFVTLTTLPANSPIYYRICDDSGCGDRFWFKTAPIDNTPFTVVAGGDTRTGWTTRRQGNQLIAKIRPLFIMHGGDYTNANTASEMSTYLADWQETFSSDSIDGLSYKRIYPFVATHGNHEDGNYKTLCEVFGVDYDQNGTCDASDTYGAFNVSPLLRVYTLNSQFKNSGWSSYALVMNNWLTRDLSTQGNGAQWRIAQYHKPMYPHYSGKSDNTILYSWWAQDFYDHGMNLVVESDTHINKITYALKPTGNSYSATTTGGTVFVGEGSWGAPARSANAPKPWTLDLASIQQFKVLSITNNNISVKTAQFDSNASKLSREQRQNDPLILPNNINWWTASSIGETLLLKQTNSGKTVIDLGDVSPVDPPVNGDELTNGKSVSVKAAKGESLYFTINVPQTAALDINITSGSGDADLYVQQDSQPTSSSYICRPYKNGNAEQCHVANAKGTYHIMLRGYAAFADVKLLASYQTLTTPLATPTPAPTSIPSSVPSLVPTSTPTLPTIVPTIEPTAQPTLPPTSSCGAQWSASQVYTTGKQVEQDGKLYQANWWNENSAPNENSGQWQVWQYITDCQ